VILQAGQINTGACDDFATLVPLAKRSGAWVHVDGAFGLWARASPRMGQQTAGVELADGWATDGHKWLQTPYDSGYAIVRDEVAHCRAMTIVASYLPPASQGERDPSHYVPELSRRARGFATWAMLKHLGRDGVIALVDQACSAATLIAERLVRDQGIAVLNEVALNQVIFRFGASTEKPVADALTQQTIRALQEEGALFTGGAIWRGDQFTTRHVKEGRAAPVAKSAARATQIQFYPHHAILTFTRTSIFYITLAPSRIELSGRPRFGGT
jgi:glutamate/tyrosine decarboxylase-like PLP-dependent enzyme